MRRKPEVKDKMIAAVPNAAAYYW